MSKAIRLVLILFSLTPFYSHAESVMPRWCPTPTDLKAATLSQAYSIDDRYISYGKGTFGTTNTWLLVVAPPQRLAETAKDSLSWSNEAVKRHVSFFAGPDSKEDDEGEYWRCYYIVGPFTDFHDVGAITITPAPPLPTLSYFLNRMHKPA